MLLAFLIIFGLGLGSFVNALVWRLHIQAQDEGRVKKGKARTAKAKAVKAAAKVSKRNAADYSILKGRSMCPHCRHQLTAADLIPVLSWLMLRRRCRYCKRPISLQYPLVELSTALLFVASYLVWPYGFDASGWVRFVVWLVMLTGFVALTVYDIKWMLLPNTIVYPLIALAVLHVLVQAILFGGGAGDIREAVLGVAVGAGIFYAVFELTNGRWIGGGDVKLGMIFGLLVGGALKAFLVLFVASVTGTLFILPLMAIGRLHRRSRVPFGPFLLLATAITFLVGDRIIDRYMGLFGY